VEALLPCGKRAVRLPLFIMMTACASLMPPLGRERERLFFDVNISRLRDNSFRIGYPCWREKLQKGPEAKARSLEHEAFYGAERTNTGKYRFVF
jgi:hypothetical protein